LADKDNTFCPALSITTKHASNSSINQGGGKGRGTSSLRLSSSLYRRASGMGFNRRKMEDQRRDAAEKEAAERRATDIDARRKFSQHSRLRPASLISC
jgi:hypothetical protein